MRPSDTPLIASDAIELRVAHLAAELSKDLAGENIVALCVLKGAIHFASDLVRKMTIPVTIGFVRPKSYVGTEPPASVMMLIPPTEPLAGRTVLIVEDILDTGRTTQAVLAEVRSHAPYKVCLITLLNKRHRRAAAVQADFTGFEIGDHFVVGYGLDHEERYRELPDIHILENGSA